MLQSWTSIDLTLLLGSSIDLPSNVIFMTDVNCIKFGHFKFYFDKEAVSVLFKAGNDQVLNPLPVPRYSQ